MSSNIKGISCLPLALLCISSLFYSCNRNGIAANLKEMYGKEIIFPDSFNSGHDYVMVHYIDSSNCTSCKLKAEHWKSLFDEIRKEGISIDMIFVSHPKIYDDAKKIIFNVFPDSISVLNDLNNNWRSTNDIPPNDIFHSFLIKKGYGIIVIGNPITNEKIKQLMYDHMK